MTRRVLRIKEVVEMTGVPENTFRYYRANGMPCPLWRLGGRLVAYEDEVTQWLDDQRAADAKASA